ARASLNYGHTLAHALETTSASSSASGAIAHGEAVGIGLPFPANPPPAPARVPGDGSREDLLQVMKRDKKAKGGLTFVLPGPNGLEIVDDLPARALDAAFSSVEA